MTDGGWSDGTGPGDSPSDPEGPPPAEPLRPQQIGPYRILATLGEGGMGTVYLAEEQHPIRRRVALKIVRRDLGSRELLARFERERQALALMEHSGIARVYAAGTTRRGRPYFAMEYVPGVPITEYCDARRWPIARRLGLFVRVCLAVHHAHQKGVIHRDIKPTNVLVADGDEGAFAKVIDFGVACAAAGAEAAGRGKTAAETIVGTMEHMSPEQATPGASSVDTRSDVYALGVLLYELLTGRRPFELSRRDWGALAELQRRILEEPAVPPSVVARAEEGSERARDRAATPRGLARTISGDLDWIVLKAIEKDPARRYASASELAADVQRYVRAETVLAGRPSLGYRARRFIARHRATVAAATLIGIVVVAGLTTTLRERQIGAQRLADYRSLADRLRLEDSLREAAALWPSWPENVPAMERWIERASVLATHAGLHARRLESMRRHARIEPAALPNPDRIADLRAVRDELLRRLTSAGPPSRPSSSHPEFVELKLQQANEELDRLLDAGQGARRFVFDSEEEQRIHDSLSALVDDLEALADPATGLIAEVRGRIVLAHAVERATLVEARDAWERAAASIADPVACPKYGGLRLPPQIGLIPLGRDPASGLWEFLVWGTGDAPRGGPPAAGDGLVLVLLPGGTLTMGTDLRADPVAWRAEAPVHDVSLDPFFISKHEMTRGQWRKVTASDPTVVTPERAPTELERERRSVEPVDQVSWKDCRDTLARIGLEIPTEAQWEYAARAGTRTRWHTGSVPESLRGHANLKDAAAFRATAPRAPGLYEMWLDDGFSGLAPVGRFRPNAFGLHDVAGNVSEWVRDWFQVYDCPVRPGTGERIPVDSGPMLRLQRGGSCAGSTLSARVAGRSPVDPGMATVNAGVRPGRPLRRSPATPVP